MAISLSKPEMQVDFAVALVQLRDTSLQEALSETVKRLKLSELDRELPFYANDKDLSFLASKGLRGEIIFATPILLQSNPRLLGYYRLILGFSQKAFYDADTGVGSFKGFEERGLAAPSLLPHLPDLCRALNGAASYLLNSIPDISLTRSFLDDLALLTLGPQLRGGANVKRGAKSIIEVFDAIKDIVQPGIVATTPRLIEVLNAAKRPVRIEFAADPDIIIRERLSLEGEDFRNIVAIEVKGGTDFSNIHNRIGEAEKSHQKTKNRGYVECWTVVNVDKINLLVSSKESPSTNRFYRLSHLVAKQGVDYQDFASRIISLVGLRSRAGKRKN